MHRKVYRTELNPVSFLERTAFVFPGKLAVVHGTRRYTYAQLSERVNRLASFLRAFGVKQGDRVAFLCPNIPPLLEAHFAVPAAGGVLVTLNTRLSAREIEYIVRHSGARLVFVDSELWGLVEGLPDHGVKLIRITDTGEPGDPYEDCLAQGSPVPVDAWLEDEEETLGINYTSGTTGQPKGVMVTYRGCYLRSLGNIIDSGLSESSVYLWTLPMFHCNGWGFPWSVTAVAGTHVCLRKVDPQKVWDLFDAERVTHYSASPTVHICLVNHPKAKRLEHPVRVQNGGAPISPTLLAQLKDLNMSPVPFYGLTETYGPITVSEWHPEWEEHPSEEQARLLSRQGQSDLVADLVRVVDPNMNDVPRDGKTQGEVVMRGNNVMKGYYKDPTATETAFRGGWFHSGDLGVWDTDGYIDLRDRAKDIIISGGENISTIEVEHTLARHPAVLESAVVAIPDDVWGERPKAFVTLKSGQSASEVELISFCRDRIAHYKCPVAVEFCDLPKTSTGKIQKYVLRERAWAGKDKRIN
jgi:fatty-acyl-CoA synthase